MVVWGMITMPKAITNMTGKNGLQGLNPRAAGELDLADKDVIIVHWELLAEASALDKSK